jgi:hypothetical protein
MRGIETLVHEGRQPAKHETVEVERAPGELQLREVLAIVSGGLYAAGGMLIDSGIEDGGERCKELARMGMRAIGMKEPK